MLLTEYKIENNKPIIYEIGRNKNGEKYQNIIKDFKPYFYVLSEQAYLFENDDRVIGIKHGFKEIYGREVTKIIVNNPFDIRELSSMVEESFEADVDLNNRYTIDKIDELEKEPISVCFIDIETDHDKTFSNPRQAKMPITAITCYNTLIGKMITFCWHDNKNKLLQKKEYCYSNNIIYKENNDFVIVNKRLEKENIDYTDTTMFFDNERDMLLHFLSYIEDTNPDIFSAWNSDFDMGYIVQRLYNIALNQNRLSPMGIVIKQADRMNKDKDNVTIKGRIIFDLLTAYKKMNFKGLPSYKLDNVAEKELGEKKVEYEGTLAELWRNNFDKFIEYNKKDVELLIRIDRKRKLIESYDEIRRMSRCKFEDLFESTKVWDSLILYYAQQKNIILPSKGYHSKENFAGATVLSPIKGLHEYVSVVDFSALYPSNDRTLNASPETISPIMTENTVNLNIPYLDSIKMESEISVKSHREKLNKEFGEFFVENWNIEKQKFNCNVLDKFLPYLSYKKIYYNQDKQGLIPEIFEYLGKYRKDIQIKRNEYEYGTEEYDFYERKQYATKILVNSGYGVISYKGFRLYKPEIGASITYLGRCAILWSKRLIEQKGYSVIFSDTDSLGFHSGDKDNFKQNSEEIQTYLNSTYDEFVKGFNIKKHYLKLEFEKTFGKVLFGDAKKRYAGKICYYKGKEVEDMLIMGFELVRSDVSIVGKETQKKFFDMLFLENKTRKELTSWLRQRIKMIREDKFSIEEIGIPTPLNKPINEYTTNLPIVRGVEYSNNELGLDIQVGEKVKLIYVKGNQMTDVIAFRELKELPKNIVLDYDKHIDEAVKMKCERIFNALGWSMSELEYGGNLLDF